MSEPFISADFLASDFISTNELPPLLQAAEQNGLVVLPVIISASRFSLIPQLGCFQAINDPSRPIAGLPYAEKEAFWLKVANSVEAVWEGRKAADGWSVANERIVHDALQKLVNSQVNKAYLIIESGDYYIQFKHYPADTKLYCESVSDYYLSESAGLSKRAVDSLLAIGFEEGTKSSGYNYQQVIILDPPTLTLRHVSAMAIGVLRDIYKVSPRFNVKIKFGAEAGNCTELL